MALSELTRIRILLEALDGLVLTGNLGKQNLQYANMPITTGGGNDSIGFAPLAGKKIIGVVGVKNASGLVQLVSAAPGYALTAATQYDRMYLTPNVVLPAVIADFNVLLPFTGVGTTAQWTAGAYDTVTVMYANAPAPSQQTGLIQFVTVDAVNTYSSSEIGAMNGVPPALVVLANQILLSSQYTIAGNDIILDGSIVVVAGDALLIVPTS